jgi:hypothetical protein
VYVGKLWVLDTETKGTGAAMVPLESILRKPSSEPARPIVVPPKRGERPEPEPAPKLPPRFKVVDVMTREVLAEDATGRALIDLLKSTRSVVDVQVHVWDHEDDRWRLLTLGEQQAIWNLRDR